MPDRNIDVDESTILSRPASEKSVGRSQDDEDVDGDREDEEGIGEVYSVDDEGRPLSPPPLKKVDLRGESHDTLSSSWDILSASTLDNKDNNNEGDEVGEFDEESRKDSSGRESHDLTNDLLAQDIPTPSMMKSEASNSDVSAITLSRLMSCSSNPNPEMRGCYRGNDLEREEGDVKERTAKSKENQEREGTAVKYRAKGWWWFWG